MIEKVIIAEDHESSNLSVQKVMEDLRILQSDYFYYCDDALNRIKVAKNADKPYEVLITDLYFDDDGTSQTIKDGFELIKAAREVQPDIRVIVFSLESSGEKIKALYDRYHIDGFVHKARHDVKELKIAFDSILKGDRYYSRETLMLLKQTKAYEFSDFDISILRLIADHRQKEIAALLNCSPSTIEKTLKKLRDEFGFVKNEQLVVKLMDVGLL